MKDNLKGFTLSMALMDTLPVIFFSISVAVLSQRFASGLFRFGAILVIAAGSMKVLWKFILTLAKKDVRVFNRQMRLLMPAGFALMLIGLIMNRSSWSLRAAAMHVVGFPALLFFILAAVGIALMTYFARHLDGMDARSNWIEQGTNALAQFFFMMGILI